MDRKRNVNFPSATNTKQTHSTDDPNRVCKAVLPSGTECRESESLKILDEINELYADRLHRLEESGVDCKQLKIKTLESWVNDLGEQNAMLIRTVEELEQEAADRVALLAEKLEQSSRIALEYMGKIKDCDKQMQEMKSKLTAASLNEGTLVGRVENLQNDITSLLKLIKRAREFDNWDIGDLVFKEVTPEDIFAGVPDVQPINKDEIIEKQKAENEELRKASKKMEQNFKVAAESTKEIEAKVKQLERDIEQKNSEINDYVKKMKELRDKIASSEQKAGYDVAAETEPFSDVESKIHELELEKCQEKVHFLESENIKAKTDLHRLQSDMLEQQAEIDRLTRQLQETERKLHKVETERDELRKEAKSCSDLLQAKLSELASLNAALVDSEKYAKDMREALTAEVAEKHDQVLALRRDVQQLEDRCRQADMQTHFKDDIIKEMRKDIKMTRSQLAILEGFVKEKGYSRDIGQRLKALNELSYSLPSKYSYGAPAQDHQNSRSKKFTQSLPYTSVRDSSKFSHMPEHYSNKSPGPSDVHSGLEKSHQYSKSWHYPVTHERPARPRAKNVRTQGQRVQVEILKHVNDEIRKHRQQPAPFCEVEVMESTMTSRTIAVQYYHPKPQVHTLGLIKLLEAKEKQIAEIEGELKIIYKNLQDSWTRTRYIKHDDEEYEEIRNELDAMVEVLEERNAKIDHQNHLLKEMQQRVEDTWEELSKQNERGKSYLIQMTTAQLQQRKSDAKLQQLMEAQSERQSLPLHESVDTDFRVPEKEQIKALQSEVGGLHDLLDAALEDTKRANEATRKCFEEKEKLESSQKKYELRILELTKTLHVSQEKSALHATEERDQTPEMDTELTDQIVLMKKSQKLNGELLEVIDALLKLLKEAKKADGGPALELLYAREGAIDITKDMPPAAVTADAKHQQEIKGLQKQLSDSQNEVTDLKHQLEEFSTPPPAIVFAKEVEEYRVRTVEAQAVLEDMKDEMDSLHQNLQIRETQVADFEKMIKSLQDTLLNVKKEMGFFTEKTKQELMQHNLNSIQEEKSCSHDVDMAGGDSVMDKQDFFVSMESSLSKACQDIGDVLSKAEIYLKQKEALEMSRCSSELKFEKLQLELEDTQESLRDTVTTIHDAITCY